MLFPQLVAGPIVRYSEIYDSICDRQESRQDFVYGIRRFVIGLGKKVILADLLASVADGVFSGSRYEGRINCRTYMARCNSLYFSDLF